MPRTSELRERYGVDRTTLITIDSGAVDLGEILR